MQQVAANLLASIPSPESGVWQLGPFPIRAYAMCILLGIVVAYWLTAKRYAARGGNASLIADMALWGIPFGIIGARLYHVLTDWHLYFGPGGSGIGGAIQVWSGGIGIWGAAAGGMLGVWIACRRNGVLLPPVLDAIAPGFAFAQAIGRFGNWFNQELFGRPTDLPWALEIAPSNRPADYVEFATFHPTFLYESLWCLAMGFVVIWADRRFNMGHGRVAALYVALYCLGRLVFELVRIDSATLILGVRVNVFTSVIIGLLALAYVIISARRNPGRETSMERLPEASDAAEPAPATKA
ncbi:MAG: prolipoprotein diacylglyceryl transferase [Candidatus Nanopelagicales bacterium]